MNSKGKFELRSSSYKRELKNLDNKSNQREPLIVFSLKDFDINQGQTFKDWEENELLALAVTKLVILQSVRFSNNK